MGTRLLAWGVWSFIGSPWRNVPEQKQHHMMDGSAEITLFRFKAELRQDGRLLLTFRRSGCEFPDGVRWNHRVRWSGDSVLRDWTSTRWAILRKNWITKGVAKPVRRRLGQRLRLRVPARYVLEVGDGTYDMEYRGEFVPLRKALVYRLFLTAPRAPAGGSWVLSQDGSDIADISIGEGKLDLLVPVPRTVVAMSLQVAYRGRFAVPVPEQPWPL